VKKKGLGAVRVAVMVVAVVVVVVVVVVVAVAHVVIEVVKTACAEWDQVHRMRL
jgi:hypothetical protein